MSERVKAWAMRMEDGRLACDRGDGVLIWSCEPKPLVEGAAAVPVTIIQTDELEAMDARAELLQQACHEYSDKVESLEDAHLGKMKRANDLFAELAAMRAERDRLREALDTISGGWTDRFPGAPDVMATESPLSFRSQMWTWSQAVARAALAASGVEVRK